MGTPSLEVAISHWTLLEEFPQTGDRYVRNHLEAIQSFGYGAYASRYDIPHLKEFIHGACFKYSGVIEHRSLTDDVVTRIRKALEIGKGPINCALGRHDTPYEESVELAASVVEAAIDLDARVHIETHRNSSTETPEKLMEILEGVEEKTGRLPLINFDFSHYAVMKHLDFPSYQERLLEPFRRNFQMSNLWHIRPFCGQHAQIPITDGNGNFSSIYREFRPFIKTALQAWLEGPRPENTLWIIPELGTTLNYNLPSFPNIWEDTIRLVKDIEVIWNEIQHTS